MPENIIVVDVTPRALGATTVRIFPVGQQLTTHEMHLSLEEAKRPFYDINETVQLLREVYHVLPAKSDASIELMGVYFTVPGWMIGQDLHVIIDKVVAIVAQQLGWSDLAIMSPVCERPGWMYEFSVERESRVTT